MSTTIPRRYPRKMKKRMAKTALELTSNEYASIKEAAKAKGMRPMHYIQQVLADYVSEKK